MSFLVNKAARDYHGDDDRPLLWYLREELKLTGTKFGCGVGACGACTVHVDGEAMRACSMPVTALDGRAVTTIEGLQGRVGAIVQATWRALDVAQCGWCQPGQIMTATALLTQNPKPDDTQIADAFAGNICRCATYARIRQAVSAAAAKL